MVGEPQVVAQKLEVANQSPANEAIASTDFAIGASNFGVFGAHRPRSPPRINGRVCTIEARIQPVHCVSPQQLERILSPILVTMYSN